MYNTKEHILKTSLLLFLQKSYKEVTMREIVEKTGLSKGAFYHYFVSKEDLFKEIVLLFFSMGVIDYSRFPKDSLAAFYKEYLDVIGQSFKKLYALFDSKEEHTASLNIFLLMFEAISKFPEFLEMERKQYLEAVDAWKKVIAHAKESVEIQSESTDKQIADLFLYCTDGVFLRFVNSENNTTYRESLSLAFDSIYTNLKA